MEQVRQPRFCFKVPQGVPELNDNEWSKQGGANCFIFCCSSSRRKIGVSVFKVPQGDDEWNSNWRKDTEGENQKNISSSMIDIILNINL